MERLPEEGVVFDELVKFDKSSVSRRVWTWLSFSVQAFFKLLFKYRGWDILYYTNPPMSCWASLLLRNKFSIMVYDIYPDALKTVGIGEKRFIYRIWVRVNRKLYKKADKVFTLSEGMKSCIERYATSDKIQIIPLWSGSSKFHTVEKSDNPFLKDINLQDKFIVLYSGNMGYTHSVDVLVEVAEAMRECADAHFLIIGEGRKKAEMIKNAEKKKLSNITFLTYQPVDILPFSIGSADIGVISLDDNVSNVSVPSKTFNLLATGAPLLAIANEETEIGRLIKKYDCGRCIPKNNVAEMVSYISRMLKDKELHKHIRNNALKASRDFTFDNAKLFFGEEKCCS